MNSTEADTYKPFLDEIKVAEDWLIENTEKVRDLNRERVASVQKVKEIEQTWEEEKARVSRITLSQDALKQERRGKENELAYKKRELEELRYSDKLDALILQQPDFEEALRGQVKIFADNRFSGLSFEDEASNHKTISDGILDRMGKTNFGADVVEWRSAKVHYDQIIREICDSKLRGKQITAQGAQFRFQEIIRCLKAQETRLFR